ncbi:MAG: DUF1223 domain-containing protein [Bacteroidetes bacterium]|nr:DUF1223 domain-containing protein [Bacteroidota bacterium]
MIKCTLEATGVAVLELFTSESCYDCPKSDEALGELIEKLKGSGKNVITIAQHVDYWDDLTYGEGECEGTWKDRFSKGVFSYRQFNYASSLKIRAATPQVVFNGTHYINDPGLEELEFEIDSLLNMPVNYSLCLELNRERSNLDEYQLAIDYRLNMNIDSKKEFRKSTVPQLQLFLLQKKILSQPTKGENCGNTWNSHDVARGFTSVTLREGIDGTTMIEYPKSLDLKGCKVVGFIQNIFENNFRVVGGSAGFEFVE